MSLNIRRVVTGHDDQGRAKVLIDEQVKQRDLAAAGRQFIGDLVERRLPGEQRRRCAIPRARRSRTTIDNGTVFRIVSFGPGVSPRNHRTDSIDYAVVISGEIDMELDIGSVHLKAGDVLVQRGTIHNWVNKGTRTLRDRVHADRRPSR